MGYLAVTLAEETYNLAYVLQQRGFKFSIFAHTTSDSDCMVYGIYSNIGNIENNLSKLGLKNALDKMLKLERNNNADGKAIEFVAKKFTSANNSKVLIVMSDGQPSAKYYLSDKAKGHTKNEVIKLRNKGIKVMSVSLVKRVIKTNDEIYGKENNIFADTIESQLTKIAQILA